MNDLLNQTLGAVGQVGEAFDKFTGGRALRGALAGKPRELLSVLPFSDTAGITDAKDKTSGRDLTDSYGITSRGDNSFGSHAAGFLADTALSPGNLLGGYAAFKAAPTLAKGITNGTKALTGLDAFDGLGRGLGNLARGEAGAAKIPNSALLNDSVRKYLPWAGQSDIPSSVREAAAFIGPQYPGGREKLFSMIPDREKALYSQYVGLSNHPEVDKIASEIPEGSKFLGRGAEALALSTPVGGVIRLAPSTNSQFGSAGRADIPELLQPFRSIQVPGNPKLGHDPWIVEHLPMVDPVWPGDAVFEKAKAIRRQAGSLEDGGVDLIQDYHRLMAAKKGLNEGSNYLGHDLRRVVEANHPNLNPWDFHGGNVAMTREGNAIGHDGGMVSAMPGQPPIERWSPRLQRPASMEEANQLGAADAVREAMARGLAAGTKGQGVSSVPGSDLAAILADQRIVRDFMARYGHMANAEPATLHGVTGVASSVPSVPAGTPATDVLGANQVKLGFQWDLMDRLRRFTGDQSGSVPIPNAAMIRESLGGGLANAAEVAGRSKIYRDPLPKRETDLAALADLVPYQRAEIIGRDAGARMRMFGPDDMTKLGQKFDDPTLSNRAAALYFSEPHMIALNRTFPEWDDTDLMSRFMAQQGPQGKRWMSSSDPDHIINHEVGHALHREGLGFDKYNNPFLDEHNPHIQRFLGDNLSKYSATDPRETVAEIVAALKANSISPTADKDSLQEILKIYGGDQLWQNLGDNRLLKGLGLSGLGMLGLGAQQAGILNPEAN